MWNEIKAALNYALEGEKGRKTRKVVLIGILGGLILFLLNQFVFFNQINFNHFFIHSALARLLFHNNISPYRNDIIPILNNYFSTRPIDATPESFKFADPIFQLFFYLPFSWIQNPRWSAALFMTVNQGLLIVALNVIYKLFNWKPDWKIKFWMIGIAFLSIPGIYFFMNPDLSVIQVFLFLLGLDLSLRAKAIQGGVLLGLSFFSFSIILLPLIVVIYYLSLNKKQTPVVWFFISVVLLSLFGAIFDNSWLLKLVRNFFTTPQFFPFTGYSTALDITSTGAILPALINFVPIILFIMIVLEWVRMPKESHLHLYWLVAFLVTIYPVIAAQKNFQPSSFSIFSFSLIIYLWITRSEGNVKKILLGIFIFLYVVVPLMGATFPSRLGFLISSIGINLLLSTLTLTMLYWVRWWVVQNPLETSNLEE